MVAFPGPAVVAVLNTVKLNLGRRFAITLVVNANFGLVDVGADWSLAAIMPGKELD